MTPFDDPRVTLALLLALITLGYTATCAIWPFKACKHCGGTGKLHSPLIKAVRLCPRCPNASGLKLRAGRKAWNAYRRLHHTKRRDRRTTHR